MDLVFSDFLLALITLTIIVIGISLDHNIKKLIEAVKKLEDD